MPSEDEPPVQKLVDAHYTIVEEEKIAPEKMKNLGLQKQHSVVDMSGDERKVRCYEDQYCIGSWNVWSRNKGKLDMVKQEMTRLKTDTLGIGELKWIGMDKFN